jgi:hypothetical protein
MSVPLVVKMQLIGILSTTAVKLIAIASVVGGTLGVLDARHAKASDFDRLIESRMESRIEYYEEEIKKVEDSIHRLKVIGTLSDS